MALTKDGRVYEWTEGFPPTLIPGLPKEARISQIAAGCGHSMALTPSGQVFCWGWNKYGQLGVGDLEYREDPEEVIPGLGVHIGQKIVAISCGEKSSFAVGDGGDVR